MRGAYITGLAGETLEHGERVLLAATRPAGIILFARNCSAPEQVRQLIAEAKAAIGSERVLVLIDQEGGRVQRLRPPHWRDLPPAAAYARLYREDAATAVARARSIARLTAADLTGLGINCNCTPVVDVPVAGAHEIIGDRAFGADWQQIVALARAVADGHVEGGVVPVMKHVPGHGRAAADSHLELPVVGAARADLEASDFAPFHALRDLPAAMTAHVVYSALDSQAPASTSPFVIDDVIRGKIGFDGLLMTDDLGMKALAGSFVERAAAVITAGCDVALHCSGDLAEMEAVAAACPALAGPARRRFDDCIALTRRQSAFDVASAEADLAEMLAYAAVSGRSSGA